MKPTKEVAGKMSKKHNDLKNCMLDDRSDKRERKLNEHNQEREKETLENWLRSRTNHFLSQTRGAQ